MDAVELIRCERESFPVHELANLLGVGKTESYWILKHREIATIIVKGKIRILRSSFQEWYSHQTKYQIIGGPPPGEALREMSYSVKELADLLAVSEDTVYTRINRGEFETFTVDGFIRITKESFERWYVMQQKHRKPEDRALDAELLKNTYSLPEIARMLGVHRNIIYGIVGSKKRKDTFKTVWVGGQLRITIESFERWLSSQSRYKLKTAQMESPEMIPAEEKQPTESKIEEYSEKESLSKQNYRIEDVQEQLGISKKAIYKLIQAEKITAIKVGKTYLISASEYERITERSVKNGVNCSEE